MTVATIGRRPRWAPPPHARIDWSHPLAQGLVFAVVGQNPTCLASGRRPTSATEPAHGSTAFGGASSYNGSTQFRRYLTPFPDTQASYTWTTVGTQTAANGGAFKIWCGRGSSYNLQTGTDTSGNFWTSVVQMVGGVTPTARNVTTSTPVVLNTATVLSTTYQKSGSVDLWKDGLRIGTTATSADNLRPGLTYSDIELGRGDATNYGPVCLPAVYVHSRVLTPSDLTAIYADPFQMLVW